MQRTTYSTLHPEGKIPVQLQRLPRWCRWKLAPNAQGKPTKRPLIAPHDHTQWLPFAVVERDTRWSGAGIGFVMHGGVTGQTADGSEAQLVCLELDACRDPITGVLSPCALDTIEFLNRSYAEAGPSGTGLRIVVWVVDLPSHLRRVSPVVEVSPLGNGRGPEVQVFTGTGWVTFTGARVDGTSEEPAVLANIDALLKRHQLLDIASLDLSTWLDGVVASGHDTRGHGWPGAKAPQVAKRGHEATETPSFLLTLTEAAELLRVSRRSVRRWIATGRLPAMRTAPWPSGRLLVRREDALVFVSITHGRGP